MSWLMSYWLFGCILKLQTIGFIACLEIGINIIFENVLSGSSALLLELILINCMVFQQTY